MTSTMHLQWAFFVCAFVRPVVATDVEDTIFSPASCSFDGACEDVFGHTSLLQTSVSVATTPSKALEVVQVEALQTLADESPKASASTKYVSAMADGKVTTPKAKDTVECPLVRGFEPIDYKHVSKVVQILDGTGRTYFLSGGSSIALLRFGALEVRPDPERDERFAFDNDLDFMIYLPRDSDYHAFCNDFDKACQEAGIFETCGPCKVSWKSSTGQRFKNGKPVSFIRVIDDQDEKKMLALRYGKPFLISRADVLPVTKAKYINTSIPVPRSPLKFLSRAVQRTKAGHEYGDGCDGLAYPTWITGSATPALQHGDVGWIKGSGSHVLPMDAEGRNSASGLNIKRIALQQCASALDSEGFASFYECFDKSKATSDDSSDEADESKPLSVRDAVEANLRVTWDVMHNVMHSR